MAFDGGALHQVCLRLCRESEGRLEAWWWGVELAGGGRVARPARSAGGLLAPEEAAV